MLRLLRPRTLAVTLVLALAAVGCQDAPLATDTSVSPPTTEISANFTDGPAHPGGGVFRSQGVVIFVGVDPASGLAAISALPEDIDDFFFCGGTEGFTPVDIQTVMADDQLNVLGQSETAVHVYDLEGFSFPASTCDDIAAGTGKLIVQQHDSSVRLDINSRVTLDAGGEAMLHWSQEFGEGRAPDFTRIRMNPVGGR